MPDTPHPAATGRAVTDSAVTDSAVTDSAATASAATDSAVPDAAGAPGPTTRDVDVAIVVVRLSSDPAVTELPSGSVVHRYEVTARLPTGTETVPVAWFDPARPPSVSAGDRVTVVGRVRRRFYRAGGSTRSATEVVATSVSREGRNRRASTALAAVLGVVDRGRD